MLGHGRRVGAANRSAPQWSRQRMLVLLVGVGIGCAVLIIGLVLAVSYAIHPVRTASDAGSADAATRSRGRGTARSASSTIGIDPRDALAEKAMAQVSEDASHPGPVSTATPGSILLPAPSTTGPAQVPTGFPHTPTGAMAQLATIDQVAMQSDSLAGAQAVIRAWAMSGGPSTSSWSVVQGLAGLFNQLGLSSGGSAQLVIVLTPLMGQLKGRVGNDFVVPCIDFEVDVTFQQTARAATADCQRMVWNPPGTRAGGPGGRWVIGPGAEPATPPSVWPDTDTAIRAGYQDLRQEPHS